VTGCWARGISAAIDRNNEVAEAASFGADERVISSKIAHSGWKEGKREVKFQTPVKKGAGLTNPQIEANHAKIVQNFSTSAIRKSEFHSAATQ
jgi:hypothetical protein